MVSLKLKIKHQAGLLVVKKSAWPILVAAFIFSIIGTVLAIVFFSENPVNILFLVFAIVCVAFAVAYFIGREYKPLQGFVLLREYQKDEEVYESLKKQTEVIRKSFLDLLSENMKELRQELQNSKDIVDSQNYLEQFIIRFSGWVDDQTLINQPKTIRGTFFKENLKNLDAIIMQRATSMRQQGHTRFSNTEIQKVADSFVEFCNKEIDVWVRECNEHALKYHELSLQVKGIYLKRGFKFYKFIKKTL